jgi:hypothetical protein
MTSVLIRREDTQRPRERGLWEDGGRLKRYIYKPRSSKDCQKLGRILAFVFRKSTALMTPWY